MGSLASRITSAFWNDIKTDRGMGGAALRDAAVAAARIRDSIDRRFFFGSLSAATGIAEDELRPRLHQQEEALSQQRRPKMRFRVT